MDIESWLAFVTIWFVACFGVGPNSVTCATAGATNGFWRGLWSAVGISTASLVHALVAVFGFSALLLAYADAYTVLKWFGIAYLVYLGTRLWWRHPAKISMAKGEIESRSVLFRRAFVISISNPQAILTYLAFFTPALNPNAPLAPQVMVLVPTAVGIVALMYTGYVISGAPLRFVITSAARQLMLNRITGTFYFATAAFLATAQDRR
jgi:homoserine/homoserine lactone efflux protein